MYVTMMMTDQMLELPPLLNGEVPMMHHMINGDASQQVILVQVNPGETFTIRREDGTLQCIQGPAEVPMMSPNGSIPPIHVPPGYISQVLEDNTGVRRVVVTPHSECYPPSYSPALSPTHHLPPPYMTHPHFIPASHTAYYPPASPGDVPPHQYYQHRLPPIYSEEIFPLYNMSTILREEYCKPQPKKPKERGTERPSLSRVSTPPSSSYKSGPACSTTPNGYGKSHGTAAAGGGGGGGGGGASPGNKRAERRSRGSPKHSDSDQPDPELEARRDQDVPSGMDKPQVSMIQARSALVSWSRAPAGRGQTDGAAVSCSYELLLADKGCDGKYRVVYSGEEPQYTLTDLRPATDYHVRVSAVCNAIKGPHSEARTFTTHSAPPETPLPPRLSHRTKSSLTLQWKPPVDNGSKITSYKLEWDEGKKNSVFRECYFGHQRHFKVMRLCPAGGYTFRVAARNDIGSSGFSPEVVFHTTGSPPQMPSAPRLLHTGASWAELEWSRPSSYGPEEALTYTLEMQDETKGAEFQAVYTGVDLSSRVEGLSRNTQYRFRLTTCSAEWRSSPSSLLVCRTSVDKPGPPAAPGVSAVTSHGFCVSWEPPHDDGGSGDLTYLLEMSEEGSTAVGQWVVVYRGSQQEHVCEELKAATRYSLRISAESAGGRGQYTDSLVVCTLSLPPGPCHTLAVQGSVKHREVSLQWEAPVCVVEDEALLYSVEMTALEDEEQVTEVYNGSQTECIVGNLLPGATYRFRVRATNDAGFGPYTKFLEVTTAAGPPGQCGAPVISLISHSCAVVSWETDESSGADVSGYRLDWGRHEDSLELVYSGTETSCEISELEAAVSYCCRIQATNQAGAGPYSELAWCRTPAAAPSAVSSLYVQDGFSSAPDSEPFCPSTCLALAWDEPNCNGQEIGGYTLTLGEELIAVGAATCTVIRNLQPDTEYSVQLRAENAVGAGPFGPSLQVRTRPLPPNPPRLECGSAGPQSLKLRWGDSSKSPNTDTDTTYILQMEDRNQRFVPIYRGPSHTFKVQRLNELSRYSFRIQAVSEAGEGPFSEIYSFTTTKSVPPTLKAPRVSQLEGNACEVSWESVPPMRGDRITYVLQVLGGRESEYRQVYKGEDTVFQLFGLQWNTDYRLRVFVCRRCADTSQELCGSFSPSTHFCPRRTVSPLSVDTVSVASSSGKKLTDEQFASIIVVGVASVSIFIAYLLHLLI
ncbi:fibronectin type III domain-containing protein 3B [Clarias gariepinus]|uniref:fibronectin type III domain-containing protein 3B isoform X1 n=1 Tax=Clarias gariepinus TaxID=13013 RepID=UPI00234DE9DC|nr:fibronectin type III domain-containing protein 3B isoform X1 [Clarias gariepinus]